MCAQIIILGALGLHADDESITIFNFFVKKVIVLSYIFIYDRYVDNMWLQIYQRTITDFEVWWVVIIGEVV